MLIIEDGTGKPDAQSYVDVAGFRAFAAARGIPVPSDDTEGNAKVEQSLIAAIDYLETMVCFQGRKTKAEQALSWPRKGVYIDDELYPDNVIPADIKTAQMRLTVESINGIDLMPTISGNAADFVVKEKVGPIETEYADPTKFSGRATFTAVDALLAKWLGDKCRQGVSFKVYRG